MKTHSTLNAERNHQGLENRLLHPTPPSCHLSRCAMTTTWWNAELPLPRRLSSVDFVSGHNAIMASSGPSTDADRGRFLHSRKPCSVVRNPDPNTATHD